MTACLLKPALYVLQCLNSEKSTNGSVSAAARKGSDGKNGGSHSNHGASNNGASEPLNWSFFIGCSVTRFDQNLPVWLNLASF